MASRQDPDVVGKVVLITGAGRGIGQAMATSFAQHGAKALVLVALEADELQETAKLVAALAPTCRVLCRALDVRDAEQVAALVADAAARVGDGRIDILCANAGVAPPMKRVGEVSPDAWWLGLEVNLKGCFLVSRYVLPLMEAQKAGRIIFTSSIAAGLVEPLTSNYQISKLAVTRLADCIDVEYKHANVKTFALHPGRINTRLLHSIEDSPAAAAPPAGDAVAMTERPAQLDDVGTLQTMCIFLASPAADFLSGRWVDGTRSVDDLCREKDTIVSRDLLRAEVSTGWDPEKGKSTLPRTMV